MLHRDERVVRALLALRATYPDLTLVVDEVRAAGEDQVSPASMPRAPDPALSSAGRRQPLGQWGPSEVWRVANGQLVERWGGPDPAVLLPLGQAPISVDALGPGRRRVTVTR